MGSALVPGSADEFAKFIQAEVPRWAEVVKKSGAKAD
jgi:tripartite-type tricarboxylate transporter receptor subunit TctC